MFLIKYFYDHASERENINILLPTRNRVFFRLFILLSHFPAKQPFRHQKRSTIKNGNQFHCGIYRSTEKHCIEILEYLRRLPLFGGIFQ